MRVVNFSESFRMTCAARPKSPSATMRIEEVPPNTTNKYLTSSQCHVKESYAFKIKTIEKQMTQ